MVIAGVKSFPRLIESGTFMKRLEVVEPLVSKLTCPNKP